MLQKQNPESGRNLIQEVKVLFSDPEILPSLCHKQGSKDACKLWGQVAPERGFEPVGGNPARLMATTRGQQAHAGFTCSALTHFTCSQLMSET